MKAGIINIGDEILIGQITNTNSSFIASQLNTINIATERIMVVGDNRDDILQAFEEMLFRCDIVFVTGGLGTTNDDITKNCVCHYFNNKLVENKSVLDYLQQQLKSRNLPLTESIRSQALLPEDCEMIENHYGLAPGMWIEKDGKILISTPGVPQELESMMSLILERLQSRYHQNQSIVHKYIQTCGIAEAMLSDMLIDYEKQLPEHIKLAYLPKMGYTSLRLSGFGTSSDLLEKEMQQQLMLLEPIIKEYVFSTEDKSLIQLIADKLQANHQTLATAESCTGGYIAHLITSLTGSSTYFKGSIVAYSNEIKHKLLHVQTQTLENYGAVSQQVVEEMAKNILSVCQTDYSIAVSGIAGPDGGSEQKPVGTVWIAIANKNNVISQCFSLGRGRERVIRQAATKGLLMLHEFVDVV